MVKRILMIDDETDLIDAVRMRLEAVGYAVSAASNGLDGVDLACKERPGLIILDLVMPSSNGIEALSKLKSDPRTALIPVIVMSAKSEHDYILDAGRLGAADYLVKPVSMESLLEHIRKYL